MKNIPCATAIKQRAHAIRCCLKRPTIRQTLHYEVALLPCPTASDEHAFRLRLGGTHVSPLWKWVLIGTTAMIAIAVACKCKCRGKSKPKQTECPCESS